MWEEVILFKGFWQQQQCCVFSACLENSYWQTWTCELCKWIRNYGRNMCEWPAFVRQPWDMGNEIHHGAVEVISRSSDTARATIANRFLIRRKCVHTLGSQGQTSFLYSPGEAAFRPQAAMRDPWAQPCWMNTTSRKKCPSRNLNMIWFEYDS